MRRSIFLALCFYSSFAFSGSYKCISPNGDTTYQPNQCKKDSSSNIIGYSSGNRYSHMGYISEKQKRKISLKLEGIDISAFFIMVSDFLNIDIQFSDAISGTLNLSYNKVSMEKIVNDVLVQNKLGLIVVRNRVLIGSLGEVTELSRELENQRDIMNQLSSQ